MKTKSLLILLSILLSVAYAQDKSVPMKVGAAAPPLHLDVLLQASQASQATWDALKGNVVVIEFWATWCGPCRAAIPHLNELVSKYKNKPVSFISITSEEEWKVKAFLSVNPMAGWIGIDRANSFYTSFGFKTIPQTVLVDQKGKVAALLQPSQLTEGILDQLLAGKAISLPVPEPTPSVALPDAVPKVQDQTVPPLTELVIRPAKPSVSASWNQGTFRAKGMSLKNLISYAFLVSTARIIAAGPIPEQAYEVTVRIPDEQKDLLRPLLQQAMAAAFGLKTWREKREMEVLILRLPAGQQVLLRPSEKTNSNWMTDDGSISGSALTIENFRMSLEDGLHTAVLDETGLKGTYDIALYWNYKEEASVFQEIRKQLGLELKKERRPIEVLCYEIGKAPAN
ncbi:MAG: TIGR03435 family protein [Candidatus Aminicenantes bacterium]|nr:TIGR03435 family protein [Candidatus Aminicenantes bacterium]